MSTLFILMLGGANPTPADDEPRALIERALKARGGAEAARKRVAYRYTLKGHFSSGLTARPGVILMAGELLELSKRSYLTFDHELGGSKTQVKVVLDGDNSWSAIDGRIVDFRQEEIEWVRGAMYRGRVKELTALLTDKGFTLAPSAESLVEGRPAHGIKVSSKGRPDISLYFDKETGLLVKYAYRTKKIDDGNEALFETVLSEYRLPDLASADEKILRAATIGVSGPALVAFLRRQTPDRSAQERIRVLIRQLGDDVFRVREKASKDLAAFGSIAIPFLRAAAKSDDPEVVRRAQDCLQQIGEWSGERQIRAAIRLLGLRKPEGAAEVLLNYLSGGDAILADEARACLFAVASKEDKSEPALLQGLHDNDASRRQATEAALGKDGGTYARNPGRRLFAPPRQIAKKHIIWMDGKLYLEMETSDYQFFNAFEDKVFAKP